MYEYTKAENNRYYLGGDDQTISARDNTVCKPKVLDFAKWFSFLPWLSSTAANTLLINFMQYTAFQS